MPLTSAHSLHPHRGHCAQNADLMVVGLKSYSTLGIVANSGRCLDLHLNDPPGEKETSK
jgi:hypothetical protein